jgi:membrane protein DedA with SNARE-associated domain
MERLLPVVKWLLFSCEIGICPVGDSGNCSLKIKNGTVVAFDYNSCLFLLTTSIDFWCNNSTMGKKILSFLIAHIHPYGYVLLLLVTILETSAFLGMLVPGDTVVVLCGFLASQGKMKLQVVIPLASIGAITGDNIGYAIGYRFGLPFLTRHGKRLHVKEKHIRKAETFFKKHGGMSIILGRFVTYIRTFIPVLAGISRMDYKIFLLYNAIGGILWASILTTLGYLFGSSWELISRILGVTGTIVFFLGCAVIAAYFIIRRRRAAKRS